MGQQGLQGTGKLLGGIGKGFINAGSAIKSVHKTAQDASKKADILKQEKQKKEQQKNNFQNIVDSIKNLETALNEYDPSIKTQIFNSNSYFLIKLKNDAQKQLNNLVDPNFKNKNNYIYYLNKDLNINFKKIPTPIPKTTRPLTPKPTPPPTLTPPKPPKPLIPYDDE